MNEDCGCCQELEQMTPISTANKPGLNALIYRVGTHASFLETMKTRLSNSEFTSLANLKTRSANDPAIAFLDAWATVADVLTFYQERIINEGYLRTATERRSVLELARLVGYSLRPGVAATVYPAFTMETGYNNSTIPSGTRIQSLPAPGEMPQFFETSEKIEASANWNNLQPRLTRPHYITQENAKEIETLYFQGSINLKPNDPLLLVFSSEPDKQVFRQVEAVEVQAFENRTFVQLQTTKQQPLNSVEITANQDENGKCPFEKIGSVDTGLLNGLLKSPSVPPANASRLGLTPKDAYTCESDIAPQLLTILKPRLADSLYTALKNTPLTKPPELQSTQTLHVKTSPFGANAPLKPIYDNLGRVQGYEEWSIAGTQILRVRNIPATGSGSGSVGISEAATTSTIQPLVYIDVIQNSTQSGTIVSRQILLNGQNFEVFLGQNTVRINILSNDDTRQIRFINAMVGRGAVDIYLDNTKVLTAISQFEASNYFTVSTQIQNLIVTPTGQQNTIFQLDLTSIFDPEQKAFSIIAIRGVDEPTSPQVFRHNDDLSQLTNQFRVRAINASSNTITSIRLNGHDTIINLGSGEYITIGAVQGITQDITVTLDNNQTLTLHDFKFESETVYDILIVSQPNTPTGFTIEVYHTPSWLAGEDGRIVFQFVQLKREFRVIYTNTGVFAQVSHNNNNNLLTSPISINQTQQYVLDGDSIKIEWAQTNQISNFTIQEESPNIIPPEQRKIIALDAQYDQIIPQSWVVIQRPDKQIIAQVLKTELLSKVDYGISGKVTQLTLNQDWLQETDKSLQLFRQTTIYAQSEALQLAQEVIDPKEEPIEGAEIELSQVYHGLKPGRWLIVSGERADLGETTSVKQSELVMLLGVNQHTITRLKNSYQERPGDNIHTFLQLKEALKYKYKRDTVTIYGNVVKATHGETRTEVLGSGDGSKPFQQFTLKQPPLTYIAAPTQKGAASTLEVRVNDILWHETDSLVNLNSTERGYIIKTDDNSQTTVIFGNGKNGVRLPTGIENVRAVYRSGIGKVGNVKAEQISILAFRPLGLKGVINPLPATGGADKESRDQARRNAPLAVMALDRLVSVSDYADFARTFAGIAKASAQLVTDGRHQLVHLTIVGVDDIPIDKSSDLYRNLSEALRQLGDINQPIKVEMRELMALIIGAKVKILPDYLWEAVESQIRQTLLQTFGFERRQLGQDVTLGEVISTIQTVEGVDFVDINIFDAISETDATNPVQLIKIFEQITQTQTQPRPRITVNLTQIATLLSAEPRTLILNPL